MSTRNQVLILAMGRDGEGALQSRVGWEHQRPHPAVQLHALGCVDIKIRTQHVRRSQVTEELAAMMDRLGHELSDWMHMVVAALMSMHVDFDDEGAPSLLWPALDERLFLYVGNVVWQTAPNINSRYRNQMRGAGILWVWQLVQKTPDELTRHGFGDSMIAHIPVVLNELSNGALSLGMTLSEEEVIACQAHCAAQYAS